MTWVAFSFLLTGVLLNAGAQLLLKAGTNALGVITLTRQDWLDQFGRMAAEPHLAGGIACYVVSVVVWPREDALHPNAPLGLLPAQETLPARLHHTHTALA